MLRRLIGWIAALLFLLAVPGSAMSGARTAQMRGGGACPEGLPVTGDLGIEYLLCVGGRCAVNLRTSRGGYTHDFSTEPIIRGIRPGSPAAGELRNGDILVAIDGCLVTTREGGRRLANLEPGVPVTLRIRRDGEEMDVVVVPETGCNAPRLAVRAGREAPPAPAARPAAGAVPAAPKPPRPAVTPATPETPGAPPAPAVAGPPETPRTPPAPAVARPPQTPRTPPPAPAPRTPETPRPPTPPRPPIYFGMELECGDCGWRTAPDGAPSWYSPTLPKVRSVEPGGPADQAGIRPGDLLLEIDRRSFSGNSAGRYLGKLRSGQKVTLEIQRGTEKRSVAITPMDGAPTRS